MDNYLPLPKASQLIHVPPEDLNLLMQIGKIKAIMVENEPCLLESDVMASQPRKNFEELENQPISLNAAAEKYGINKPTLSRWKNKGYIKVLYQEGQKIFLNEADVAYLASVYHKKPGRGIWTAKKANE